VREKQPIRSARDFAVVVRSAIPRQTPPPGCFLAWPCWGRCPGPRGAGRRARCWPGNRTGRPQAAGGCSAPVLYCPQGSRRSRWLPFSWCSSSPWGFATWCSRRSCTSAPGSLMPVGCPGCSYP
jgi:hypothetical protein